LSSFLQGDGRWYPARIVSVGGSATDPRYSVLFKGYDSTEILTSESLRPLKNAPGSHGTSSSSAGQTAGSANKRSASTTTKISPEEELERERKRKRSEKKAERSANKSAEANAIQNSWQKFAKKAEKKGTLKGDKSMFKTPEDPLAKGELLQ
jgi:survival-of-motor-neuron-related-splicing factor 30